MMPTTQKNEQKKEIEQCQRDALNAVIGEQVLHTLGHPSNLLRVQARRLWENNYRVNIYIGADITSATIAHSYFVEVDGDGNIVESTPKITKLKEAESRPPSPANS